MPHVYMLKISHAKDYHVYKNLYDYCKWCKPVLYDHASYMYYLYHNYYLSYITCLLYVFYVYCIFSSFGTILSLIAYHLPS